MKKLIIKYKLFIILISLFILPFISFSQVNQSQLVEKDEIMYLSNKPYTGKCYTNFDNGKTGLEGSYKNGKKDGEWIWYYENGIKKRSTTFKDGVKQGKSIYWYKTGIKKSEIIFDNDRNIRQTSWDETGKPTKNPSFEKF